MKRVVTIGGGTGSFTLLSGIKNIENIEISAIVAMTDDGGSTGTLRDELGVLPPGDIRQCLVALSEEDEIFRKLISYRFENGNMKGSNFGNIFLAGLEKITGDFNSGLIYASKILKIKGEIFPIIENKSDLVIELKTGKKIKGEDCINNSNLQKSGVNKIYLEPEVEIYSQAKERIISADYIIIAPGSLYCSILPNFLAKGFKETLKNSKAKIIYIPNLANKRGHTTNFKLSDYLGIIEEHLGRKVDIILFNSKKPKAKQLEDYELEEGGKVMIENDLMNDQRLIAKDILSTKKVVFDKTDVIAKNRSFIRHDSVKLKTEIEKLFK